MTQLAEGLHRALSKLISMLRRGGSQRGCSRRLTLAQLSSLVTLSIESHPDDRPGRSRTGTNSTTTVAIGGPKGGLVKRSRDPSDLRAVLVDITPQGRAVLITGQPALALAAAQHSPLRLETSGRPWRHWSVASERTGQWPCKLSPALKRA